MNTLKYLIQYIKVVLKLTSSPSIILPRGLVQWTDEDAQSLMLFFKSPIGKKFEMILKNVEAETNARAIIQNKDFEYNAGTAFGSRCMLAHIFSLAATIPQPNTGDEYDEIRNLAGTDDIEQN
jgi:hypothetical protein